MYRVEVNGINFGSLLVTSAAKCPHFETKKDVVFLQETLYRIVVYVKEMPTEKQKYC